MGVGGEGGREAGKMAEITQHCAIFRDRESAKLKRPEPTKVARERDSRVREMGSLTLSFPRGPKIKIQDESQISFCKILKYK